MKVLTHVFRNFASAPLLSNLGCARTLYKRIQTSHVTVSPTSLSKAQAYTRGLCCQHSMQIASIDQQIGSCIPLPAGASEQCLCSVCQSRHAMQRICSALKAFVQAKTWRSSLILLCRTCHDVGCRCCELMHAYIAYQLTPSVVCYMTIVYTAESDSVNKTLLVHITSVHIIYIPADAMVQLHMYSRWRLYS